MLRYSFDDLELLLGPSTLRKGQSYWRQGRVRECRIDPDAQSVSGRITGTAASPYRATVRLGFRGDELMQVDGVCSCPVAYNCKHVAALLLAVVKDEPTATAARPRQPANDPLARWLSTLEELGGAAEGSDLPERIVYVLEPAQRYWQDEGPAQPVAVRVAKARRLQSGGYGRPEAKTLTTLTNTPPARFVRAEDQIIGRLLHHRYGFHETTARLRDRADIEAMRAMLATGRCHWRSLETASLCEGPAREGRFAWVFAEDGRQTLALRLAGGSEATVVLALDPPWYLDPEAGVCGPIATPVAPALAANLLSLPPVPPEAVGRLSAALDGREALAGAELPRPHRLDQAERRRISPRPILALECPEVPVRPPSPWDPAPPTARLPLARLSFDYDGARVPWTDPRPEVARFDGTRLVVLPRDRATERGAVAELRRLDLTRLRDGPPRVGGADGHADDFVFADPDPVHAWAEFNHIEVPRLRAAGWRIEFAPDYPLCVVEAADAWYAHLGPSDNDWFGLDLGIEVEGRRVPLLPVLLDLLRDAPDELVRNWLSDGADDGETDDLTLYTPLPDGALAPLPLPRLRAILRGLFELLDGGRLGDDGRLLLERARAATVVELEDSLPAGALRWRGGEELRALGRRLRGLDGLPAVAPPHGLTATLRPYQRDGLSWLQFLREFGFHGVLADDMGLGKTVQTLAHILVEREAGRLDRPCLVVAPTSLMATWHGEAARFAPELRVLVLHGPGRKGRFGDIAGHDIVLTSYALLLRDSEQLLEHEYHLAVLDEAQAIKNPATRLAQTAHRIRARHRLCLTGTPMENHLGELWSLFHYLMPGFLGDRRGFARAFRTPIERHDDRDRRALLARRVRPFLLRRTKDEVAPQLPPKTEIRREVELEAGQRDLYESVRLAMHAKVREAIAARGLAQSGITILEALLKLRQVCCDPRLLKARSPRKAAPSAKLDLLFELLPTMVEEGRRILLFSQFVEMLELIEAALGAHRLSYVKLTGRTRDRRAPVERFQAGKVPLFLVSLKAGGTGLNLTAADTVIHYDPWWNPAVEAQATDRAHRIGQDKRVFVYKLIARGTVEEKMLDLQARKQALTEGVLTGTGGGLPLNEEDVERLFQPLPA